jgi:hypothetical protein
MSARVREVRLGDGLDGEEQTRTRTRTRTKQKLQSRDTLFSFYFPLHTHNPNATKLHTHNAKGLGQFTPTRLKVDGWDGRQRQKKIGSLDSSQRVGQRIKKQARAKATSIKNIYLHEKGAEFFTRE